MVRRPAGRAASLVCGAALAACLAAAGACGGAGPAAPAGPAAADTIVLRVLVVVNPDLPNPLPFLDTALARASEICRRDLEAPVLFVPAGVATIDSVFAEARGVFPEIFASFETSALDPFAPAGEAARRTRLDLVEAYGDLVAAEGVEAVRAALGADAPSAAAEATTPTGLAGALADLHIGTARAALGRRPDRLRSAWEIWEAFIGGLQGADVLVTNQPFVSLSRRISGVPTALAGGVRLGGTVRRPVGPLAGAIAVSTFPTWSDAPLVRDGRAGLTPDEVTAYLLAHEAGHLVRGWPHADHSACLMALPLRFRVGAWIRDVADSGPCRRPHAAVVVR